MKKAASLLSFYKQIPVLIVLIGFSIGCYYIWEPLLYFFLSLNIFNFLKVAKALVVSTRKKGWAATRLNLAAAMQEVRQEQAEEARLKAEAELAELKGEEVREENEVEEPTRVRNPLDDCSFEHPVLSLVSDSEDDENQDDDQEPPKFRVINGGS